MPQRTEFWRGTNLDAPLVRLLSSRARLSARSPAQGALMRRILACVAVFASLSAGSSTQQVQPGATAASAALAEPAVVVIDTGTRATALYHRDTCSWLKGSTSTLRFAPAEARRRYFQPHCPCISGNDTDPPCASAASDVPAAAVAPAAAVPTATAPVSTPRAATPRVAPASTRCQAITKKRTQCSRRAQPGRSFCWQH
jgi:hypothetical protein